jgi:hypothetical protein
MEELNEELRAGIEELVARRGETYDLSGDFLDKLVSVFPFNRYEYVISHLLAEQIMSLSAYLELRSSYLRRNRYLYIFEITAPRTFGETWAHRHLNELVPELEPPSRTLDPSYSGEYDFWLEGIRIEVKASRAVRRASGDSLINKALAADSPYGFDMNFQQLKVRCCDVFVWIGVWRDEIRYWVLSSQDVQNSRFFSSGQHRGNVGEGQLWLKETNIREFDSFLSSPRQLLDDIKRKGRP